MAADSVLVVGPDVVPHGSNDWCHTCGQRSGMCLDVSYSKDAENCFEDRSKYLRICAYCVGKFQEVLKKHFAG